MRYISAENRIEALRLLLLESDLVDGKIDELLNHAQESLEQTNYGALESILDEIDSEIINILK